MTFRWLGSSHRVPQLLARGPRCSAALTEIESKFWFIPSTTKKSPHTSDRGDKVPTEINVSHKSNFFGLPRSDSLTQVHFSQRRRPAGSRPTTTDHCHYTLTKPVPSPSIGISVTGTDQVLSYPSFDVNQQPWPESFTFQFAL